MSGNQDSSAINQEMKNNREAIYQREYNFQFLSTKYQYFFVTRVQLFSVYIEGEILRSRNNRMNQKGFQQEVKFQNVNCFFTIWSDMLAKTFVEMITI